MVSGLAGMVRVRVRSWVIHYAYLSPHNDAQSLILLLLTLPFSLPYVGLQHDPCCHGDSAQHWSGYFVRPLFYLRMASRVSR